MPTHSSRSLDPVRSELAPTVDSIQNANPLQKEGQESFSKCISRVTTPMDLLSPLSPVMELDIFPVNSFHPSRSLPVETKKTVLG